MQLGVGILDSVVGRARPRAQRSIVPSTEEQGVRPPIPGLAPTFWFEEYLEVRGAATNTEDEGRGRALDRRFRVGPITSAQQHTRVG